MKPENETKMKLELIPYVPTIKLSDAIAPKQAFEI